MTFYRFAVATATLIAACSPIAGAESRIAEIARFNQALSLAAESPHPDAATLSLMLAARAALVRQELSSDSVREPGWMLSDELATSLRRLVPDAPIEQASEQEGPLQLAIADDFQHARSETQWFLSTAGERLTVVPGRLSLRSGAKVRIAGIRLGGTLYATSLIHSDSLPQSGTSPEYSNPLGPQHLLVLLITTPSHPSFPAGMDAAFFQDLIFTSHPAATSASISLNDFVTQSSYGKASVVGQVAAVALQQDYTCDLNAGSSISNDLSKAADAAISGTVDITLFNRIVYLFTATSCPVAGVGFVGSGGMVVQSQILEYSVSWVPVFPYYSSQSGVMRSVIWHEFGHNLGLLHANSDDYGSSALGAPGAPGALAEYGDPFSVMGTGESGSTGTNYAAGQFNAYQKAFVLNWLTPADFAEVKDGGTWQLQPFEAASGTRALRVLRDPQSQTWLWLEFRQPVGSVDASFASTTAGPGLFSGALVHYEDPLLDPVASYLITMNPKVSPNNFSNAVLVPGVTWTDPWSPLRISVDSPSPAGLAVHVTYAAPCAALTSTERETPAAGSSDSVSVSADSSCAWSVTSSADWLRVQGPAAGSGSASVPFSVASNSSPLGRLAYITVGGQTFPVRQAGSNMAISQVAPDSGGGSSGLFQFRFTDTLGAGDIEQAEIVYLGDPGCHLTVTFGNGTAYVYLEKISGQLWGNLDTAGWVDLSSPGKTVSNGSCSLTSNKATFLQSGSEIRLGIPLQFLAGSDTYRIMARASSKTLTTGYNWTPVGRWSPVPGPTVGAVVSAASFAPAIAAGGWTTISGVQLSGTTRQWLPADFFGRGLPFQLDSVSVRFNGIPGYVSYVSPGQINVLAPDDVTVGPVQIQVSNGLGWSPAVTVTRSAVAPAFFQFSTRYPVAVHANGTTIAAPGSIPGVDSTPAYSGETIVFYGTGFGQTVTPAPSGELIESPAMLAATVTMSVGGKPAVLSYAGRTASGLDQINVTVPTGLPAGDAEIVATVNGVPTQKGLYVTLATGTPQQF